MPRTPPGSRCVISREKRTRTLWTVYVGLLSTGFRMVGECAQRYWRRDGCGWRGYSPGRRRGKRGTTQSLVICRAAIFGSADEGTRRSREARRGVAFYFSAVAKGMVDRGPRFTDGTDLFSDGTVATRFPRRPRGIDAPFPRTMTPEDDCLVSSPLSYCARSSWGPRLRKSIFPRDAARTTVD